MPWAGRPLKSLQAESKYVSVLPYSRAESSWASVTAGEDDADGVSGPDGLQRGGIGLHLAVDAALPDPAGNELIVLSAEVQHDDSLVRQGNSSFV